MSELKKDSVERTLCIPLWSRAIAVKKLPRILPDLNYTMSEAGGVSDFVRKYTLASGGPYCDCGYRKKRG